VILAAGALGSEYSWGTLRTALARRPERAQFLIAKLAAIMLLLLIATLVCVAVALPLGWLGGAVVPGGDPGALGAALVALPVAVLRALFVLLPYVLLTLCFTVAGRSLLAGAAGGLVYLVIEGGLGGLALVAELGEGWRAFYNLTIGQNINALAIQNSHDFGLRPELITPVDLATLPPLWQATLVVLLYCLSFLGAAIFLLRRRDVGGAG
jgi:ABC-type transport system involved in multi-copper enzyme maturation permease subunit